MAVTPSLSCLRAPVCTRFFFSFNFVIFDFHLWVFVFCSANSSCCLNFFQKKNFFFLVVCLVAVKVKTKLGILLLLDYCKIIQFEAN